MCTWANFPTVDRQTAGEITEKFYLSPVKISNLQGDQKVTDSGFTVKHFIFARLNFRDFAI